MFTNFNPNDNDFQKWLKGELANGTEDLRLVFTKTDGTERKMQCTLSSNRIPTLKQPKGGSPARVTSGSSLCVFDTQAQDWRSFRWQNLKSISISYPGEQNV